MLLFNKKVHSIEIKKSVDFKVSFLTALLQFEAVQLR